MLLRPQGALVRQDVVRAQRVFRVTHHRWRQVRHAVPRALLPFGLPRQHVVQPTDLPHAVFAHVFVFVNAGLEELRRQFVFLHAGVVRAAEQQAAEAALRGVAVRRHSDDRLHLIVIEQKAVQRRVFAAGEVFAEPSAVKAPRAFLTLVDARQKRRFAILGEQVHHAVIHALVDPVAIRVVQALDGIHIFQQGGAVLHLGKARGQRRHGSGQVWRILGSAHALSPSAWSAVAAISSQFQSTST